MLRRTFVVACTTAGCIAMSAPALAAPPEEGHVGNPGAACQGTAASEHGANDEPGTWARDVAGLRQYLKGEGYSLGEVFSRWAQVDAATHGDCEAALFGILVSLPPR